MLTPYRRTDRIDGDVLVAIKDLARAIYCRFDVIAVVVVVIAETQTSTSSAL